MADASWKKSVHYDTKSGMHIGCVECHLPPKGENYLLEKGKTGLRDLWSFWTKDSASFNWDDRRRLEVARGYVYESSCIKCHENLFPAKLTKAGEDAHLYYKQTKKTDELHCINCHLNAGHYIEGYTHGSNSTFGNTSSAAKEIYTEPTPVNEFKNFTEQIPQSSVSFNMIAIPGGKFKWEVLLHEPFRKEDEGPVREVEISHFLWLRLKFHGMNILHFMFRQLLKDVQLIRKVLRKTNLQKLMQFQEPHHLMDSLTRDGEWGRRPAISFSYHAAETYCKWLSKVTGKTYRLPTEAEWEYACRAGSEGPYFFPGDPKKFEKSGLRAKISKNDTA